MLTLKTKYTLAILHDIYLPDFKYSDKYHFPTTELYYTLKQLQTAGLVKLLPGKIAGVLSSYILGKSYLEITLLDVLVAIDEGIRFNHKADMDFYEHYGCLARKLGVVNHMTRLYLKEFHIFDFPVDYPDKKKEEI